MGVVAVLIGVALGALLGTVAGYARGAVDRVVSTLFDAVLAFPALVLATALVASRGRSVTNVVVVIGLVSVPLFGRVARSATLSVAERDFVAAARTFGAPAARSCWARSSRSWPAGRRVRRAGDRDRDPGRGRALVPRGGHPTETVSVGLADTRPVAASYASTRRSA